MDLGTITIRVPAARSTNKSQSYCVLTYFLNVLENVQSEQTALEAHSLVMGGKLEKHTAILLCPPTIMPICMNRDRLHYLQINHRKADAKECCNPNAQAYPETNRHRQSKTKMVPL